MTVVDNIREMLKKFTRDNPNKRPGLIKIDRLTEWDFIGLTANEIGSAVDKLYTQGPRSIRQLAGIPLLWDADENEIVAEGSVTKEDKDRLSKQAGASQAGLNKGGSGRRI